MDKSKAIERLLRLHCENCNGKAFNCRGCTKEAEIEMIISNLDEQKEEVIEVPIIEEKPKKKTKK